MGITPPPSGSAETGWQVIVYYNGVDHRMDVTFSKNQFAISTITAADLTQQTKESLIADLDEVLSKAAIKANQE